MPEQTYTEQLHAQFIQWVKDTYGRWWQLGAPAHNILSDQNKVNELWNYWYKTVRPTISRPSGRLPQVDNENYVTTIENYEQRLSDFLNHLVYKGALTVEEAIASGQNALGWVELYNNGQASFGDLPFVNDLSRRDFKDWFNWYAGGLSDQKKVESEYQQAMVDYEGYHKRYHEHMRYLNNLSNLKAMGDMANYKFVPETKRPTSIDELKELLKGNVASASWRYTRGMPTDKAGIDKMNPPYYIDTGLIPTTDMKQAAYTEPFNYASEAAEKLAAYKRRYSNRAGWF